MKLKKRKPRKVVTSRTGTRLHHVVSMALVAFLLCSCNATQRITVKQLQGEQQQETTIEHGGSIKELSLHFNSCPSPQVNYPQTLTTSKTLTYGYVK